MERKRTLAKRMTSFTLCIALVMSGLMVPAKQAQAEESQEVTTPTTMKTIAGLGTSVIADPTDPGDDTTTAWAGSYVYYGNYDADGDETAEPVKYRVLDANTTKFGGTTMLLDCDSILYYQKFDNDGTANEADKNANDWSISDVKSSLNGDGFLNKAGVFTTAEKNAISASTVATHALTTNSATGVNVADWTQSAFVNYVALDGEQIFLLDAEDVSNGAYGYSMTDSGCENRKKEGSSAAYWWLRSADLNYDNYAGFVGDDGGIGSLIVSYFYPGVSPALNLNLSSVIFSSVISGIAGETGAEYKLTLLDSDMTIAANVDATRYGKTVTIPYGISGNNSGNATQVSVLVLDKEYTAGNTNGATVLDYQKLNVDSFSASGTGTYTLPDSLYRKGCGTDYHMYILAEDVNGEKETDYASTPVKIIPTWKAPTVKEMNFGTQGIIDPAVPNSANDAWKGCYVYYGNYDADGDGTAEPVKYRVLDASTTEFGGTTMLLDCDSILYYTPFDNDGTANADGKNANDWSISDVKSSLNGDGFLNKAGVFTTAEKNAIAKSNVASHALTTDSETGVNVASWTQGAFVNYVALDGEQIFLLDAEDVSNGAYGYSMTDSGCENRKKEGSSAAYWWLRSANSGSDNYAGCVDDVGFIYSSIVRNNYPGVSPALNLNLSSVIFTSASGTSKSSALTSGSAEIGTTSNTDWKLTLKDNEKSVKLTEGRSVTKASDGTTITVPYTYTDKENATESEKVNQISVMITDKAYDAEKAANAQEAQILYYGALQNIKNAEGTASTVAEASTGTGTFALPSGLTGTLGTDYHIYLLAEHVNADNSTDYASEPKEVTAILDEVDTVTVPSIDTPIAEQPLKGEITISSTGVAEKATLTWKKDDTEATGNAEWKTTYQAYVTLTAADGYAFTNTTGATLNEQPVDTEDITLNEDGTLTVACGNYTTATRKTEGATAPEVPTQFANYYTAEDVLSSDELKVPAKVTLEGTTQPNPEEMEVEWSIANEGGAAYDATPTAINTFKWTVKESEYTDYDKDVAVLEGTVTIQNKDYTPVTITGEDVTVTYDGEDTLDVSQYFIIDENAGTPTYELLDTSAGTGTLNGITLTMTTMGTFVIKVSTPINGVYNKGEHTLTITANRATPDVTVLPTVADRTYHPTTVLADADMTGGTVKDVSGNSLAGTWSWKEADVPVVDNDGYVAVFKPEDTVHYESVEKTISVNVSKATPYIKTVPTAAAVTYGEALSASALKDAVVWHSESDEKTVEGTFIWKEAATKPTVADSDKTEYVVVFTPTDADNYNTVETKLTLTIEKAEPVPDIPEGLTAFYGQTLTDVTLPKGWIWDNQTDSVGKVGEHTFSATYTPDDIVNYETRTEQLTVTVNPAELTVSSATLAGKDYDGTEVVSITGVTLDGIVTGDIVSVNLTNEIQGTLNSANAGTYTSVTLPELTLTGEDADNYTLVQPEKAVATTVTIHKLDAEIVVGADSYSKTFGDDAFTLDVTDTNKEAEMQYAVTEGNDVVSVSNGVVTILKAGEAVITVSLPETTNYNAAESKTVTVNVAKKSTSVEAINKSYIYVREHADTIDLAALLPADCGAVTYGTPVTAGAVSYSTSPVVSDGMLSYTVDRGETGSQGTITVTVTTDNYEDIVITVNVKLIDQKVVHLQEDTEVTLVNNALTYGQALSKLEFNDAVFVDEDGNEVAGVLAWKNPTAMPDAGTTSAEWIFTPEDNTYAVVEGESEISVKKAIPTVVTAPPVAERVFNQTKVLGHMLLEGGSVIGVDGKELSGTWKWEESGIVPAVDNSGYVAVFTPNDITNYETVKETITVTVTKATPYVEVTPYAAAITYGDTLGDSALTNGYVRCKFDTNSVAVEGTFAWKEAEVKPVVADSNVTEYTVVFTPKDAVNYNTIETAVTLMVNKAVNAPNMPEGTISVPYSIEKVKGVTLPENWEWQDADREIVLAVGEVFEATAIYTGADKGNYAKESVKVAITRAACVHTGGTATCKDKAVCETCGETYGEVDSENHVGETEVRNAKEATCEETGYTGDTHCKGCGEKLTTGEAIAATGHTGGTATCKDKAVCEVCHEAYGELISEHTWDVGVVTKESTTTEKGVKTFTCTVCGETKTEEIPLDIMGCDGAQPDPSLRLPAVEYTTAEATEKIITSANTDKGDVEGSTFATLQLKAVGKNKSVKLTWKKVKDADGYILYGTKCGKKLSKIATLNGASKVKYTHKKLKKAQYYKYVVVAFKNIDGKQYTIAISASAHAVTNGGKYANPTKVSVNAAKITVKKGAKKTIKASYKLPKNKKLRVHIAKFRYESDNTAVATVTKKGVVKGVKKGTANIYVYTQNGMYKKVKVNVK